MPQMKINNEEEHAPQPHNRPSKLCAFLLFARACMRALCLSGTEHRATFCLPTVHRSPWLAHKHTHVYEKRLTDSSKYF